MKELVSEFAFSTTTPAIIAKLLLVPILNSARHYVAYNALTPLRPVLGEKLSNVVVCSMNSSTDTIFQYACIKAQLIERTEHMFLSNLGINLYYSTALVLLYANKNVAAIKRSYVSAFTYAITEQGMLTSSPLFTVLGGGVSLCYQLMNCEDKLKSEKTMSTVLSTITKLSCMYLGLNYNSSAIVANVLFYLRKEFGVDEQCVDFINKYIGDDKDQQIS